MHPEVESEIRKETRQFLIACVNNSNGPLLRAAEAGAISFDDIYYRGIVLWANLITMKGLEEVTERLASEFSAETNAQIDGKTYRLVAQLYGCTSEEAERRQESIREKVDQYLPAGK